MIKDIKELNFPAYATLQQATVTINDMGSRSISTQVQISGEIVPDFSYDWEVEFKGERYIHPVRKPQGTKENTSMSAKIDMVFQHWAIYEMKRQYFVEMASTSAGTAVADKYIASLGLNLVDFVTAFNLVLNHYFGGRIIIKLNPEWQSDPEAKFVSISYSYIWDVLQQVYDIYGVRWTIKTNAEGVCEILMGYPAEEASHIFEYGFEGGLLSVQRQVQNTEIRNRLLGRGGENNLPLRYFKDEDPKNPLFKADPDWVPELANVAFTELRGKSFRDYVRGWKARHYDGNAMEEPTEAYLAGYNAEKFDPIEYVEDKDSIAKYGVLVGALQNNEDIYPSIQGAPNDVDAIVDAEQVTDDDVDSAVENDSVTTNLESGHQTYRNAPANSTVTIETLTKRYFSVPEGKVGNLSMSLTATGKYSDLGDYEETHPILKSDTVKVTIHDKTTGAEVKSSSVPVVNIPAGDYYYMISADVETNYDRTSMVTLNIESVYLYTSTPNKSEGWKQTFDIWVRNIWGSTRNDGETDQQYADRVWAPILGDRMGGDARVVFTSGWLSFSSDWEFPIVGYAYDDSKEGSHWRLTLAKSEAELEASGKYIPYEGYNASAGDRFFFIGIDMPYEYVIWAEERLDDFKRDSLMQTAEINPAWVIKTDKVRLNQDRKGAVLVDSLNAGSQIRLASKQFISGAYETLYVQSLTYKWTADTIMYPDVEVVVSDKAVVVKNPVAQIQSNIEAIQRQVGSMSNLQQIIRQICDKLYLRKDGISDVSKSPTKFLGKVTGENFRQGQIGGRDWGIYRDENGNAILEADKLVARQGILVTDLVVNEATYVGGLQIRSAAHMDVTSVEDTEAGYVCSFDQKQGSVTNKFTEDDVVLCQKFDADQSEVKFYKRRVVYVSETSVTLSKTDVNGTGVPAEGDVIIHYGNYTDKSRQFVIISDVIGGGYERMLMGLDSVASDGVEYYFAGKSADSKARWFVGGAEQYAEYKDGQLTIKGNIFVTGSDQNINEQIAQLDFIRNAFGENAQGLILGTAIVVGYNDDEGKFVPMAGLSGVYDKEADNGGPAAWYGGTPEDAKSVIFMDGTGYFADGLFKWDKDKGINLGNGAIWINYDGSVDFGDQIRIGASGDETLGSLLTIVATLADIWKIDEETGDLVTDRNVRIAKNVIIGGDMSSAAKGRDAGAAGGIIGVKVGDAEYTDITDGILDMTEAFEGLDVDVDLSDYYTNEETDAKIAESLIPYAKIADIASTYATKESLETLQGEVDNIEAILGMDEEAEGIINTWNEVKAFLDGYSSSDDLAAILSTMNADIAKRALDSDLDTLAGRVGVNELAIADNAGNIKKNFDAIGVLESNKANWGTTLAHYGITDAYTKVNVDDLLKKYLLLEAESQTIKGNLKIEGNLIIAGDMSSEGSGGNSGADGTVIGVVVNGTQYADETNGMLDLSTLMNQYLPLIGGAVTGAITMPTTQSDTMPNNYISVGGGFSTKTGKYGLKILVVDQIDAQMGMGADLFGDSYELSIATTKKNNYGKISFGYHEVNSTNYTRVGYFDLNGLTVNALTSGDATFNGVVNFTTKSATGLVPIIKTAYNEYIDNRMNIHLGSNSGDFNVFDDAEKALLRIKRANGNTLIGTTTDLGHKLQVNGSIYVGGDDIYGSASTVEGGEIEFKNAKNGTYNAHMDVYNNEWRIWSNATTRFAIDLTNGVFTAAGGTITRSDRKQLLLKNSNASGRSALWIGGEFETFTHGAQILYDGELDSIAIANYASYNNSSKGLGAFRITKDNKIQVGDVNFSDGYVHDLIHSGNIGSQSVASANILTKHGGTSTKASSWNPKTAWTKVWGQSFLDSSISSDYGDIVYYVRPSEYNSGTTELCCIIDGDFYAGAGGTGPYKVWHAGNFNPSDYLPKSGGTISGDVGALHINRNNEVGSFIGYSGTNGTLGYLGFRDQGMPGFFDANWNAYFLIHSGNIGSQTVATANSVYSPSGKEMVVVNDSSTVEVFGSVAYFSYIDGKALTFRYGPSYNIAMTINSSGNALIGTTEELRSGTKLQVSGYAFATRAWLLSGDYGMWRGSTYSGSLVETDVAYNATKHVFGGGNVLIGTTTDSGYKLDVNGNARFSKTVTIVGDSAYTNSAVEGGELVLLPASSGNYSAHVDIYYDLFRVWTEHKTTKKTAAPFELDMSKGSLSITGPIIKPTTSSNAMADNYISAGGGYSKTTGKYGVKILCCDQADAQSGLGQDLSTLAASYGYDLSIVGSNSAQDKGSISFVTHKVNSTTYRTLGYFKDDAGVVTFNVNGNIIMAGDLSSTSDMRLKHRIDDVVFDLKTIAEMPLFTFRWKDGRDGRLHLGSSAQYWEKPAPWLVIEDSSKTLNYAVLGVAGMKSLAVTAVDHETRIKMLERKVDELETENRRLRYGN